MRQIAIAAIWFAASCSNRPLDVPVDAGPSQPKRENLIVEACLHWTACVTQPRWPLSFNECAMGDGSGLSWPGGGVAITAAQLACVAGAGLDCAAALDCVSTPAPTPCPTATWSCDGDTLSHCDDFGGSRVVTQDCAAAGLHCVPVGGEVRCGLGACDPTSFAPTCAGNSVIDCDAVQDEIGEMIGGVQQVGDDCASLDADCAVAGGIAQCVGRGPACTFGPGAGPIGCRGDVLLSCDFSGHVEQSDCAAAGLHCVSFASDPTPSGIEFGCASHPGLVICTADGNFDVCEGTTVQYCDEQGNERIDCKTLGYSDCQDGHCVP